MWSLYYFCHFLEASINIIIHAPNKAFLEISVLGIDSFGVFLLCFYIIFVNWYSWVDRFISSSDSFTSISIRSWIFPRNTPASALSYYQQQGSNHHICFHLTHKLCELWLGFSLGYKRCNLISVMSSLVLSVWSRIVCLCHFCGFADVIETP